MADADDSFFAEWAKEEEEEKWNVREEVNASIAARKRKAKDLPARKAKEEVKKEGDDLEKENEDCQCWVT